ncbi:MAG: type II secretion system F family protein [Clostridiales bacterium]|nr:type II secretion system F family protein [Clostridiales bacterium]
MSKEHRTGKPFSNAETAAFCGQMALILESGISSLEGITIMLEESEKKDEVEILQGILDNMKETNSLSEALISTGAFQAYMLNMVSIGEETGKLDNVMNALSVHYEREDFLNKSIKNTIAYPLVMAGMMVVVIIVLLVKVMPIFNQVFLQLGTEMAGLSKALMNLGHVINNYAIGLIILLVLLIACCILAFKTPKGKKIARNAGYKIRVARHIFENTAACRFAGGMALTLSSGLSSERGLELISALNEDPHFDKKIESCRKQVAGGEDLSKALSSSGIFTGMYSRMASIGQKTGAMDSTMEKIADLYQGEIDDRTNNFLSVLEPTLVIALSVIVGIILLSVMLPLMGIMSSL